MPLGEPLPASETTKNEGTVGFPRRVNVRRAQGQYPRCLLLPTRSGVGPRRTRGGRWGTGAHRPLSPRSPSILGVRDPPPASVPAPLLSPGPWSSRPPPPRTAHRPPRTCSRPASVPGQQLAPAAPCCLACLPPAALPHPESNRAPGHLWPRPLRCCPSLWGPLRPGFCLPPPPLRREPDPALPSPSALARLWLGPGCTSQVARCPLLLTPGVPGAPGAQTVGSSGPWSPVRGLTLGRLLDEVAGILSRCDPPTCPSKTSEIFAEGLPRAKICPVLQITCEQNRHYLSLPLCSLLFPTPARPSYSFHAPGPPCPSEPLRKPTSSRKPSQPASVLPGPCFISLYPTVASPRLISMPLCPGSFLKHVGTRRAPRRHQAPGRSHFSGCSFHASEAELRLPRPPAHPSSVESPPCTQLGAPGIPGASRRPGLTFARGGRTTQSLGDSANIFGAPTMFCGSRQA